MKSTLLISLLTLFSSSFCFSQEDRCAKILKEIYNRTKMTETGNWTADLNNWLKSSQFKEWSRKQSGGFSIGIPVEGERVGFGLSTSDAAYQKLAASLDSGNKSYYNSDFFKHLSTEFVNKESVEAWLKCIELTSESPQRFTHKVEYESDKLVIIRLRWASDADKPKIKVGNVQCEGATYDTNLLKNGTEIDSNGKTFFFKRTGDEEILIIVDAQGTSGSVTAIIPKVLKQGANQDNAIETLERKCWEGDEAACLRYGTELSISCREKYPSQPGVRNQQLVDCVDYSQAVSNRAYALNSLSEALKLYGQSSVQYQQAYQFLIVGDQGIRANASRFKK